MGTTLKHIIIPRLIPGETATLKVQHWYALWYSNPKIRLVGSVLVFDKICIGVWYWTGTRWINTRLIGFAISVLIPVHIPGHDLYTRPTLVKPSPSFCVLLNIALPSINFFVLLNITLPSIIFFFVLLNISLPSITHQPPSPTPWALKGHGSSGGKPGPLVMINEDLHMVLTSLSSYSHS